MSRSPTTAVRPGPPVLGVDVDVRRESRSQRITRTWFRHRDAHRNTLHDLGEVSRCIIRRQKRELRSGRATHARHLSLADAIVVGIDLELDRLAGANRGALRLPV